MIWFSLRTDQSRRAFTEGNHHTPAPITHELGGAGIFGKTWQNNRMNLVT